VHDSFGGALVGFSRRGLLEPLGGFVLDRVAQPRPLCLVGRGISAALNHERGDGAVEDRLVEEAVVHVLQEVPHGDRGLVLVQVDDDLAPGFVALNNLELDARQTDWLNLL